MDYGKIINDSVLGWYKDSKTLFYCLLYFLNSLVMLGLIIGALFVFFGPAFGQFMALYSSASTGAQPDEAAITSLVTSIISNVVPFVLVIIPIIIILSLTAYFIQLLMISRALEKLNFKTQMISLGTVVKAIALEIWQVIAVMTSWYNKPFFLFFLALIGLTIITIILALVSPAIASLVGILLVILFLIYFIVIIYNSIRLTFCIPVFLSEGKGVFESAKRAWDITDKKVLDTLVAFIILSIGIGVISFVVSLLISLLQFILQIIGGIILSHGVGILLSMVVSPIYVAMGAYGLISIYSQILGNSSISPQLTPAPKRYAKSK